MGRQDNEVLSIRYGMNNKTLSTNP